MTQHLQPERPAAAETEEQLVGATAGDPHASEQYAAMVRRYPELQRSISRCRRSDLVGGSELPKAA